ncbi:hypothetical protein PAPH110629_19465 [Paenibacillus phoenicis]
MGHGPGQQPLLRAVGCVRMGTNRPIPLPRAVYLCLWKGAPYGIATANHGAPFVFYFTNCPRVTPSWLVALRVFHTWVPLISPRNALL